MALTRFRSPRLRGHATRAMFDNGNVRLEDLVGNRWLLDASADLGEVDGSRMTSSLLDVTFFGLVATGTPLC